MKMSKALTASAPPGMDTPMDHGGEPMDGMGHGMQH